MSTISARPTDEGNLRQLAARFAYPTTPDISRRVAVRLAGRRPGLRPWQLALIAIVVGLAALLAIPEARAMISGFFRIGPIRIVPFGPTPTLTTEPAATAVPGVAPLARELRGLAGETTFEAAPGLAPFPVLVPTYPPDLGSPDHVYYQPGSLMLILAWDDPTDSNQLTMSLYEVDSDSWVISKFEPQVIEETTVNGNYALWVQGPYYIELANGDYTLRRLVDGATLIWDDGAVTYRLEGDLPLQEAIRVAESLESVEP